MDKSYTPRLEHKNPDTPDILTIRLECRVTPVSFELILQLAQLFNVNHAQQTPIRD